MDKSANSGETSSIFDVEFLADPKELQKVSQELAQTKNCLAEAQNKIKLLEAELEKERIQKDAKMELSDSAKQQLEASATIEQLQNYIEASEQERENEKQEANAKIQELSQQIKQSNDKRIGALLERDEALKHKDGLESILKQEKLTIQKNDQMINQLLIEKQNLLEKLQESQGSIASQEQGQQKRDDEKYTALAQEKNRVTEINEELWKEIQGYKQEIAENNRQLSQYQVTIQKLQEAVQELKIKLDNQDSKFECVNDFEEMKQKLQNQFEEEKKAIEIENAGLRQQCKELLEKLQENKYESEEKMKNQEEKSNLLGAIEFEKNKTKALREEMAEVKMHLQEELSQAQDEINKLKACNLDLAKEREEVQAANQSQEKIQLSHQNFQEMDFQTLLNDTILPQIESSIIEGPDKKEQRKVLTQKAFIPIINQLKEVCNKRQLLLAFTLKQ